MPIPMIIVGVALVTTIGGGAWYLGKPPYANQEWAQNQFASVELASLDREATAISDKIIDLRIRRATSTPEVKRIIDGQIESLQIRLNNLNAQIQQRRQGK